MVREFYDERARLLNRSVGKGKAFRYATVSLTEEIAEKRDEMEKERILPLLDIQETDAVLDIGCGVGRWADSIIPLCRRYVGVDYSGEMIKSCKERFKEECKSGKSIDFVNTSFQELPASELIKGQVFDVVLIIATAIYINDRELGQALESIVGFLAEGGRLYIRESVGLGKRLTLDGIWSKALNSNYSAVYRTREEYFDLLQPVLAVSEIVDERIVPDFDDPSKPDTSRWYAVLKKR